AAFYWIPSDIRLNPISASWSFSTALAHTLGGYDGLAARIAELPAETRDLLVRIEQAMINHPEPQSPLEVIKSRLRRGARLGDDTRAYGTARKGCSPRVSPQGLTTSSATPMAAAGGTPTAPITRSPRRSRYVGTAGDPEPSAGKASRAAS